MGLTIATRAATAAPSLPANPTFLLPSPCPESYQPCCTDFNGICNTQMLQTLTGLKLGQTVAVLLPDYLSNGSRGDIGYYAHALAKLVGPQGHVYTITPPEIAEAGNSGSASIRGRVVTGDYIDPNVTQLIMPFSKLPTLPRLDLVWAAQQAYRPLTFFKPLEASSFLPVFRALNPNGRFIILDVDTQKHCGRPNPSCPNLGPILLDDQPHAVVLQHVQQAGFELISETRKLVDPGVPPPGPCCIHGSFADGTSWNVSPFLWVFRRGN